MKRVLGFLILPILGMISPLVALPALTASYGAAGWAAVAIGQSIGATASVVVELGWSLTGPQRVARASADTARRVLAFSTLAKLLALAPVGLASAALGWMLSPDFRAEAALVAFGAAATGMSVGWFFIGLGQPGRIALVDALPKILGAFAAAGVLALGGPLIAYPLLLLIAPVVVSLVVSLVVAGVRRIHVTRCSIRALLGSIVSQRAAVTARVISATYISLPVALVGAVAPTAVSTFAGAERVMRLGLAALTAVPNMLQGWVGRLPKANDRLLRARRAVLISMATGAFAGTVYATLAPWASTWLFSNVVSISPLVAVVGGLVVLVVCTSRATGNIYLVAVRRIDAIAYSAAAGAIVGVPAVLLLSTVHGALGAMLGLLLAETAVLIVQSAICIRATRAFRIARPTHPTPPEL